MKPTAATRRIYDHFGDPCTANKDFGCGASICATQPLNYCTHLHCRSDPKSCPPKSTCIDIPAGASPDPSAKSICLRP